MRPAREKDRHRHWRINGNTEAHKEKQKVRQADEVMKGARAHSDLLASGKSSSLSPTNMAVRAAVVPSPTIP